MGFKVAVTVTLKRDKIIPLWAGVHLNMMCDKSDLKNLIREFKEIKALVNTDMNSKGVALKDVDIKIEFLD